MADKKCFLLIQQNKAFCDIKERWIFMERSNKKNISSYIDETIYVFEKIVGSNQSIFFGNLMKSTKGENFVLKILIKSESPISPTELSEVLHSSKSRISAILRSLEKKGYIHREIDKTNRRKILVIITDAGKKHIMADINSVNDILVKLLLEMGEDDTRELVRLTKKLVDIMKKL